MKYSNHDKATLFNMAHMCGIHREMYACMRRTSTQVLEQIALRSQSQPFTSIVPLGAHFFLFSCTGHKYIFCRVVQPPEVSCF